VRTCLQGGPPCPRAGQITSESLNPPFRGPPLGPAVRQIKSLAISFSNGVGRVKEVGRVTRVRGDSTLGRESRRSQHHTTSTKFAVCLQELFTGGSYLRPLTNVLAAVSAMRPFR